MDKRLGAALLGAVLVAAFLLVPVAALGQPTTDDTEAVLAMEAERFRALVDRDLRKAESLHAEEFVLIDPYGHASTRQQFFDDIAVGHLRFVDSVNDHAEVRVYGDAAVLKQHSFVTAVVDGQEFPPMELWEMFVYERRDGQWQVVWAMASETRY
ncbi:MAG TPA: nuclear transport factor 2 family protein [Trueperaceae bacterium]